MTNTIDRHEFELAIEQVGYEAVRTDYSGRAMYGKTCIAVVTSAHPDTIKQALLAAVESIRGEATEIREDGEGEDDYADDLDLKADELESLSEDYRSDNMGLDYIAYFPGWEFQ